MSGSFFLNDPATTKPVRPENLDVINKMSTSFADLVKQNNYSAQLEENHEAPLKSAISRPGTSQTSRSDKKTTFSMLPNFTTWEKSAQKQGEDTKDDMLMSGEKEPDMLASEMFQIKMKLEEKRKQIKSKKQTMEIQWNKQRQRVGNQVFMQVLAKGKNDSRQGLGTVTEVDSKETSCESLSDKPFVRSAVQENTIEDRSTDNRLSKSDTEHNKMNALQNIKQTIPEASIPESPKRQSFERDISKISAREKVQQKIEGVRQRWFSEEHSDSDKNGSQEDVRKERSREKTRDRQSVERENPRDRQSVERENPRDRQSVEREKPRDRQSVERENPRDRQSVERENPRDRQSVEREKPRDRQSVERVSRPTSQSISVPRESSNGGINSERVSVDRFVADRSSVERTHPEPFNKGDPDHFLPNQLQNGDRVSPHRSLTNSTEGVKGEYSSSLDKLNSSLTELQGEIMKLSLKRGTTPNKGTTPTTEGATIPPTGYDASTPHSDTENAIRPNHLTHQPTTVYGAPQSIYSPPNTTSAHIPQNTTQPLPPSGYVPPYVPPGQQYPPFISPYTGAPPSHQYPYTQNPYPHYPQNAPPPPQWAQQHVASNYPYPHPPHHTDHAIPPTNYSASPHHPSPTPHMNSPVMNPSQQQQQQYGLRDSSTGVSSVPRETSLPPDSRENSIPSGNDKCLFLTQETLSSKCKIFKNIPKKMFPGKIDR